ncbi:MAG: hypothetical protein JRJ29_00300 [Deltaproteobacteria bacterium]|nr:hypothetical protein [Deltaproteobacteria bacterium]MBW2081605.1 hypothetical protein [Deltaproteobacteria bacterium]
MLHKVYGLSFSAGTFEHGLWFDHDRQFYQPHGFGVVFQVGLARLVFPVKKIWLMWKLATPAWRAKRKKAGFPWWKRIFYPVNAWLHAEHIWFTIKIPIFPVVFTSIALRRFGIYLGIKAYPVTRRNTWYRSFLRDDEFPPDSETTYYYVHPSATIRRTRWK